MRLCTFDSTLALPSTCCLSFFCVLGGLAGARAFTLTGWLRMTAGAEGPGGDRVVNFCNGGGGVDLVWDAPGRLKLSVNEWPDSTHPQSSDGSMPVVGGGAGEGEGEGDGGNDGWPHWRFFAVAYDADAADGTDNVAWYFGNSLDAATLDTGAINGNYSKGAVRVCACMRRGVRVRACLPTCRPACLPACLPAYLSACLPACVPAYQPVYSLSSFASRRR